MNKLYIIIFMFSSLFSQGQTQDDFTANQILDSSIQFCGGEKLISEYITTEKSYVFFSSDKQRASISEKIRNGVKYTQSILSDEHIPQTTFFDGKDLTRINGSDIVRISKNGNLEEIKLKTYNQIQFGYKKLNYDLERLSDEKFKNFDCYVVNATSKSGYSTLNFFDKTNFRLIMDVYPSGNKSLMIEYEFRDNVLFNSLILNTDVLEAVDKLQLLDVKKNVDIHENWFKCPYESKVEIPEFIKMGRFTIPESDGVLERSKDLQTEIYNQGQERITLKLNWISSDTYEMSMQNPENQQATIKTQKILVRIVSWDDEAYSCHYIAGDSFGTQSYVRIK